MNAGLKGIKKFKFFEQEKPEESDNAEKPLNYTLNDIVPINLKIYEKYYYVLGKLKENKVSKNKKPFIIAKINPSENIIEEYAPFTDCIIDFDIIYFQHIPYLVVIGTDLGNNEEESTAKIETNNKNNEMIINPSPNSIPSIKFFSLNYFRSETEEKSNLNEYGNLKLENRIYLMYKKGKFTDLYKGGDIDEKIEFYNPIKDISHFSISPFMNAVAFSFKSYIMEIKFSLNNKKEKDKVLLVSSADKKNITNIKYSIINYETFLYYTTNESIYYKKLGEPKFSFIGSELMKTGANPKNFDINSKGNILISTPEHYIEEFYFDNLMNIYENFLTKVFGGHIKFIQYLGKYYLFSFYEDNKPILCVYDPSNNIFVTFDNDFKQKNILLITSTDDRIYVLLENDGFKNIVCLKECEDKKKFEQFYKKEFYDLAYVYGKSLKYDSEQLAEIAKAYAENLYKKGDYEKSVEQYKLTINYLDPTYVIQKFMDDPKKDYLIKYLEELQNNGEFERNCNQKRFNEFTTLLFNCYIKQKQIDKLKYFFQKKSVIDENTIRSAIELCKEINNTELLLSFSEMVKKGDMDELYIQILIDIPSDYRYYDQYIKKIPKTLKEIKDLQKKYNILIKFGKRLLENKEISDEIHIEILHLIDDIINIKKKNPNSKQLNNIKYLKIISLYSTEECQDKLEILFKKIIYEDEDCPTELITRIVELYLDYYNRNEEKEKNSGKGYLQKIKGILNQFKNKIDKNYLLMLFKINGFNEGIAEMSKIMELDQDLLQIYIEQKNFEKINEACKKSMQSHNTKDKKVNFWLQALYFYIEISNKSNINKLNEYILEVLDNLSKQEEFSPMNLLDILEKAVNDQNKLIEIRTIRKFFKDWIKQKLDSLKDDKKETEENFKKIEEYDKSIKDIQMSAKSFNSNSKCAACKSTLDVPFTFFLCGHGYHQNCLDDLDNKIECSVCKNKNVKIFDKIETGEKYVKEHPNRYKEELDQEDKGNKFDVFANYLGKGIFIPSK